MAAEPGRLPDLTAAFHAAGLIDVAYTREPSPLGDLLLAAGPTGLLSVAYTADGMEEARWLSGLAAAVSPRVLRAPARLDSARRELDEYFTGRRQRFGLRLDLRLIRTAFAAAVLMRTAAVPYGATATYSAVATAAGRPRAQRAVGSALGANPLVIVIPCHRIVPAHGGVGGYAGGSDTKALLLAHERRYAENVRVCDDSPAERGIS
ncbi:methylated-DNA--[protein]-cysteine S-methyltransferase [Conexibacter sp. DBS9H8]|uniref:methylated-DNA--[protein]-cysteine S-methyltransferase n=1 Tax=Conexibacter sp. DBS9H8 TaxID=2937801 RepID=UPI002010A825|nr:methylated-DNA--[protein]-cysteine S-methyltransferase [Conexibacter sp. DBS9H8]